jgi:hypothetical protein
VGDLNAFMKFQAANSMAKLAEQGGGSGGAMGMGLGAGFGMMMPGMIQQAMQPGAAPLAGPQPRAAVLQGGGPDFGNLAPATTDPRATVRSVIQAAGYALVESGDSWQVTVPIGSLRKQKVTIQFGKTDQEGNAIVTYCSICGPALERNAMSLLRYNTEMLHGAFAVVKHDGTDVVVLQANHAASTLDPLEVSRTLSAIAWQADQVEQKLGGGDEY